MLNRSIITLLIGLLVGCASRIAPQGWLDPAGPAFERGYGGWINLQPVIADSRDKNYLEGELVSVTEDTVFILSLHGELNAVARADIVQAKIDGYDSEWGLLGSRVALGTISTLSHGFILIITAPIWILLGTTATTVQSHHPRIQIPPDNWDEAMVYARYPQGIPPALNRRELTPKPY